MAFSRLVQTHPLASASNSMHDHHLAARRQCTIRSLPALDGAAVFASAGAATIFGRSTLGLPHPSDVVPSQNEGNVQEADITMSNGASSLFGHFRSREATSAAILLVSAGRRRIEFLCWDRRAVILSSLGTGLRMSGRGPCRVMMAVVSLHRGLFVWKSSHNFTRVKAGDYSPCNQMSHPPGLLGSRVARGTRVTRQGLPKWGAQ